MRPLGLTWLFRILYPHRDKCNKINKISTPEKSKVTLKTDIKSSRNGSKFKIACEDNCVNEILNPAFPTETSPIEMLSSPIISNAIVSSSRIVDDVVHSYAANQAIQCMVQFILDIRNAE